jgi:hypothetical protein
MTAPTLTQLIMDALDVFVMSRRRIMQIEVEDASLGIYTGSMRIMRDYEQSQHERLMKERAGLLVAKAESEAELDALWKIKNRKPGDTQE